MRLFFVIFALCLGIQPAWAVDTASPVLRSELVKKMAKVPNPSDEQCRAYWNSNNDMPEMQKPTQFEVACRQWAIKELKEYSAGLAKKIEAEKRKQAIPQAADLNSIRDETTGR